VDDRVQELIYDGTLSQLKAYLRETGFVSFRASALEKIIAGLTTVEEALRVLHRNALRTRSAPTVPPSVTSTTG
jgi:general secretion pathway protein E